jgi:hypothetical protein
VKANRHGVARPRDRGGIVGQRLDRRHSTIEQFRDGAHLNGRPRHCGSLPHVVEPICGGGSSVELIDLSVAKHRGVMPITQGVSFAPIRVNFTPLDRSLLLALCLSPLQLDLFRAYRTVGDGGEPRGSIGMSAMFMIRVARIS